MLLLAVCGPDLLELWTAVGREGGPHTSVITWAGPSYLMGKAILGWAWKFCFLVLHPVSPQLR